MNDRDVPEGLIPELGLCQFHRNQSKLINNSPKYSLSLKQKPRRGKSRWHGRSLFYFPERGNGHEGRNKRLPGQTRPFYWGMGALCSDFCQEYIVQSSISWTPVTARMVRKCNGLVGQKRQEWTKNREVETREQ